MSGSANQHAMVGVTPKRRYVWAEILLIFAVFFLQGAWPAPDVNEPYYLGRAIHYWNPRWAAGDFFLETADTHKVFYFAFGWLSLWLSPLALAWTGRLLTWGLMAWAWRRLSFALVPRRWVSILTAALFGCMMEHCHAAGEWVIGGVEAKGFAYVLVFLGLEALVRSRWNRAWLLFGGAAVFHVLVGGWSAVAAGLAWLGLGKDRPALRAMWPGLLGGLLLSLPGLIPSLALTWGIDPQTVSRANEIYVFERLGHHLNPFQFRVGLKLRFVALALFWLLLCLRAPADPAGRRLRGFVAGAIALALAGAAISLLQFCERSLAAGILRFYWFRLADVAVPLGVAFAAVALIERQLPDRPFMGKLWLGIALAVAVVHVGGYAIRRTRPTPPRADKWTVYSDWRDICDRIAGSKEIPPQARFLTPKSSQTFKWYTGRAEVVTWKDIPQDAGSIVAWWNRLQEIHATGSTDPEFRWHESLTELGAERLRQLGVKYGAGYLLTDAEPRLVDLDRLDANDSYAVYRLQPIPSEQERAR